VSTSGARTRTAEATNPIRARSLAALALTAAALAASLATPATAAASVDGSCTVTGTATSSGPVDLGTTDVWHVRTSDSLSITATSTEPMTGASGWISALGFDLPIGSATSSGDLSISVDAVPASVVGVIGRVFVLSGRSNGASGGCLTHVQVIVDDVNPLLTVLGAGGLAAAVLGLLGLLRSAVGQARRVISGTLSLAVAGAGLGLVLQQSSSPGAVPFPGWVASPWAASVVAPANLPLGPTGLAWSAGLTLLAVILLPFPSELFNRTLDENLDRIRAGVARLPVVGRLARRPEGQAIRRPLGRQPIVIAGFVLVSALLYGFLDPAFAFDEASLATYVGLVITIVLTAWLVAAPGRAFHRLRAGDRGALRVVPATLLVAAACVLISRLAGFQPGYLYGLLVGYVFASHLPPDDDGRAAARGAAWMLGIALAAWFSLGAVRTPGIQPSPAAAIAESVFAALTVGAIEAIVFGLVPMRYLHGGAIFRWNRVRWAALYVPGLFAYWLVVLNPANGFLDEGHPAPFLTAVGLFVVFGLASIAFWAWFRFRPAPGREA
jgi:hypothetical protein